jgi:hypothetical protein
MDGAIASATDVVRAAAEVVGGHLAALAADGALWRLQRR